MSGDIANFAFHNAKLAALAGDVLWPDSIWNMLEAL
jgi:hypothetical protein